MAENGFKRNNMVPSYHKTHTSVNKTLSLQHIVNTNGEHDQATTPGKQCLGFQFLQEKSPTLLDINEIKTMQKFIDRLGLSEVRPWNCGMTSGRSL